MNDPRGKRENADFMRVCGLCSLLRPANYESAALPTELHQRIYSNASKSISQSFLLVKQFPKLFESGGKAISAAAFSFFAPLAANAVDVALKVAAAYELGEHILLKDRYRAGIEPHLAPELLGKCRRQHHIAHAHRRGDGLGKRVHVDDRAVRFPGKTGFW